MKKPVLIVAGVILAGGLALSAGAVLSWADQRSGTPGKAKVSTCSGRTGRYGGGVHCSGVWVAGGSLVGGGHVVYGSIDGASRGDIGKEVSVRIHGSDHATVPNVRVPIILAILGTATTAFGVYLLAVRPPGTPRTPRA